MHSILCLVIFKARDRRALFLDVYADSDKSLVEPGK